MIRAQFPYTTHDIAEKWVFSPNENVCNKFDNVWTKNLIDSVITYQGSNVVCFMITGSEMLFNISSRFTGFYCPLLTIAFHKMTDLKFCAPESMDRKDVSGEYCRQLCTLEVFRRPVAGDWLM